MMQSTHKNLKSGVRGNFFKDLIHPENPAINYNFPQTSSSGARFSDDIRAEIRAGVCQVREECLHNRRGGDWKELPHTEDHWGPPA